MNGGRPQRIDIAPRYFEPVDGHGRVIELCPSRTLGYFDYQGSRTQARKDELPGSFHYDFRYGRSATFVTDMRSQRVASDGSNQIFAEDQFSALQEFLVSHDDCDVLFLVLTVPTLYVPDWMASLGVRFLGSGNDISDRWGWRENTPDRDRLLSLLRRQLERHSRQKIVTLSGDLHLGLALKMSWDDAKKSTLYEFVSSAVTNSLDPLDYVAAKVAAHAMPHLHDDGHQLSLEFVRPSGDDQKNPFSGLNIGLVDVQFGRREPMVPFRLITHGAKCLRRARGGFRPLPHPLQLNSVGALVRVPYGFQVHPSNRIALWGFTTRGQAINFPERKLAR